MSTPPPSQSNVAMSENGFAAIYVQISRLTAVACAQSKSSFGSDGSSPFAHSVALSTPPPSQSAVARTDVGFAAMIAQISRPFEIA